MSSSPAGHVDHKRVRAAESRVEFAFAGAFTIALAGTFIYVHSLFAPIAPARNLLGWSIFTSVVIVIMFAVPLTVFIRRPDDDEINRVWAWVGKVVAILYDLAVASSVWLLLPYASETLRLLMVVFYAAAIMGQVISTAESIDNIVFGVFSVFGSAALFFMTDSGPYSIPLALFLLVFGGLMVIVAITMKVAIRTAITARLAAEDASRDLAMALDRVTIERDAKTRFIAAASHDLRQPLQAAVLFFEQAMSATTQTTRMAGASGVKLAFEEADSLLDRILEHLRLDAGAVEARPQSVLVGDLLARVAAEAVAFAANEDVEIRVVASGISVLADPAMAGRALRNFLLNAIRHARAGRVLLGAKRSGTLVRLYVIDDGVGIAPDERKGLFEEYVQGAEAGRDPRGGLGLGLASARRIAHLMNGSVGLDARWKRGAAFFLDLPRATAARPVGAVATPLSDGLARTGRVLIVDDDGASRQALSGLFSGHGWDVESAAGLSQARQCAATRDLDLIICDWRLGGGTTGADVVKSVRQLRPELPALLVTGDGSAESHQAISASRIAVMYKPTTPDLILARAAEIAFRRPAAKTEHIRPSRPSG